MSQAGPKLQESNQVCKDKTIKSMYDEDFVKELYERYKIRTFGDSPDTSQNLELNSFHFGLRRLLEREYVTKFSAELDKLKKVRFSYLDDPIDCLTFESMKSMEEKGVLVLADTVTLRRISLLGKVNGPSD